ncbi:HAD family hydrolase [Thiohalorhabdus sp.]|uniref:HAD family hydrolase n=1 Tax=Thiohalorhabdus sp. TaxID=3094134 RepID=UPI002FC2F7CC
MESFYPRAGTDLSGTELVIFDWDGTLVDSRHVIVETMQAALSEAGFDPLPGEACQQVIGLGLDEAIRALVPEAGESDREQLRAVYGRRFQSFGAADMPFFPGVSEGLDYLRDEGHHLAVATGKSRRGLDRLIAERGMHGAFHATRCADETASKPDPRMLRELLADFGLSPQQAVFVGDTGFDMEMARRLDMPRIAVTYGVHGDNRLATGEPTAWAGDFWEVMDHLGVTALEGSSVKGYT